MLQNVDSVIKPKTRISLKRRTSEEKYYVGNNTYKTEEI